MSIMEMERPEPNCAYCLLGERCPCDCTEDCGVREPWCPKAVGYRAWLTGLGMYTEEEIESLRKQGYQ
jgi:hypothetical protein